MTIKLAEKIWYGKVTQMSMLTADEQRAAAGSAELGATLQLCAALAGAGAGAAVWDAPAREQALAAAVREASAHGRGALRERSALSHPGAPPHWAARRLPRRWAAVALALAVLAAAWLLGPGGGRQALFGPPALRPTGIVWAASDGTVIEGELKFADYFSGTAADPPDHPLWQVDRLVQQWSQESGLAASMSLDLYNQLFHNTGSTESANYHATVRIEIPAATESQLEGLLNALRGFRDLTDIKTYSQQFYMSEKWPETRYEGRAFVINGVEARYPHDFTKEELDSIDWMLNVLPEEHGHMYVAFMQLGEGKRFPLADVVRVRFGETIYIEDYAKHFDRSQLKLPSYRDHKSVFVPASEVDVDFDPLELLARLSQKDGTDSRLINFNRTGARFVVDLLAPDDWPAADDASADRAIKLNDLRTAQEGIAKLEAALAQWVANYPELGSGGESSFLLEHGPVYRGATPVQWQAVLWLREGNALRALRRTIESTGLPMREWQAALSPESMAQSSQIQTSKDRHIPDLVLRYELIDAETPHGSDPYGAAIKATAEQKKRSAGLKVAMEHAFNEWLNQERQKQPDLDASISARTIENVTLTVHVLIYKTKTGSEISAESLARLKQALAATGAPKPQEDDQTQYDELRAGMLFTLPLFTLEQLRGIGPDDVAAAFTAAEVERAKSAAEQFEKLVADWKQESMSERASVRRHDVAKLGTLPVALLVFTDQPPGAALDAIVQYFEEALGQPSFLSQPIDYNLAPKQETKIALRDFESEQQMALQNILLYGLRPERAWFAVPESDYPKLLTSADREKLNATIAAMGRALADWNKANPPDYSKGEAEATMKVAEISGVPDLGYIYCSRMTEPVMLSIAEALAAAGAPEYRYGMGYMNRGQALQYQNPIHKQGTGWHYALIPQVLTMGLSPEEIKQRVKPEQIEKAAEIASRMEVVYNEWLKTHPEMGQVSTDPNVQAFNLAEFQHSDFGGIVQQTRFTIWWNDDAQRQKLVDELVAAIKHETGLEPEQFHNQSRMSHSVTYSPPVQHRGTRWAYTLIPHVKSMGLNAQQLRAQLDPEETTEAQEAASKLKKAVMDWLEEHSELGLLGGFGSTAESIELSFGYVDETQPGHVQMIAAGEEPSKDSNQIPTRAILTIWWDDETERKELVAQLIEYIEHITGLQAEERRDDQVTR